VDSGDCKSCRGDSNTSTIPNEDRAPVIAYVKDPDSCKFEIIKWAPQKNLSVRSFFKKGYVVHRKYLREFELGRVLTDLIIFNFICDLI
jgi:hypothetical protein